ncbi:glycosyltransferase family 39 protein [Clostridium sp. C8-1-8]|uniref:glycosyltransferase family 39 protein n=1 Tax=Clostridium sp. C8-1-8 TaxID=2698831 RepID=UPI00136DB827|nr:glycosyltransferase family 39 protein [Clostridium sp. C8-1-8]
MKFNQIKETTFIKLIKLVFFCIFLSISFCILVLQPFLNYICKKDFLYSNITLTIIDVLVAIIFYLLIKKIKDKSRFVSKYTFRFILVGSIILFLAQVYISYNIFFITGWDAGEYVIPTARLIAHGQSLDNMNGYYSMFPNNITLVWIFSNILKLSDKLSTLGLKNDLMLIIIINCLISSISSILTYKCAEQLIGKKFAVLTWFIYFLLVGLSPWVVITYSDSFALFLPILIFYIYIRKFIGKWNILKWLLIGVTSFIGYQIKPQVLIILIAIVAIEFNKALFSTKREKVKRVYILSILLFAFLLSNIFYKSIYRQTGLKINSEDSFGLTHFAMMGLNRKTDGVFSGEDVAFSKSFPTSSQRRAANIDVIKSRLKDYGILGYAKFLTKKTLVNYGDGTFAWSVEGNFYMKTYENKNSWSSPMLKSFYYSYGSNYGITSTFEQAIWIGMIISMLGLIFTKNDCSYNEIYVLILSVLGLTMFELIFEARARYLYIYSPIYIILGVIGLKNIAFKFEKVKDYIYCKCKINNKLNRK